MIEIFDGPFAFLSNFYPTKAAFEGVIYRTSEHAFQAAKSTDENVREMIRNCDTPGRAKILGNKIQLRPDWNEIKVDIMYQIVKDKFNRNPDLAALLLKTEDATLVEGNSWHDNIWGVCFCPGCRKKTGYNHLGRILMRVRKELKGGNDNGTHSD